MESKAPTSPTNNKRAISRKPMKNQKIDLANSTNTKLRLKDLKEVSVSLDNCSEVKSTNSRQHRNSDLKPIYTKDVDSTVEGSQTFGEGTSLIYNPNPKDGDKLSSIVKKIITSPVKFDKPKFKETISSPTYASVWDSSAAQGQSDDENKTEKEKKAVLSNVNHVLEDAMLPPFSLRDFENFLKNEHSEENLEFYQCIKEYEKLCDKIPKSQLQNISCIPPDSTVLSKLPKLQSFVSSIQQRFLTVGSSTELNIPGKIMKPLLITLEAKNNLSPSIFDAALENVLTMIRLSSFPSFCRFAASKGEPRFKVSLLQVLDDLLDPPMSQKDFHEFLKQEHSEENIEFYLAFKKYEAACTDIPRDFLEQCFDKEADVAFLQKIDNVKSQIKGIISTYISSHAKSELNLPVGIKRACIKSVEDGNIHPDVFSDTIECVLTNLRMSSFPNFINGATRRESVNQLDVMDRKPRPKSWGNTFTSTSRQNGESRRRRGTFDYDVGNTMIIDLFDDEYLPPYSLKEYSKFLVDEGAEKPLEFYKAFKEYHSLCSAIPEEQLFESRLYKTTEVGHIFFAVVQILAKFFARGAKLDIQVPLDILKPLLMEINEKRNLHPTVFNDALAYVIRLHKTVWFPKYCKGISSKGMGKPMKKKVTPGRTGSRSEEVTSAATSPVSANFNILSPSTSISTLSKRKSSMDGSTRNPSLVSSSSDVFAMGTPKQRTISALNRLEDEVRSSVVGYTRANETGLGNLSFHRLSTPKDLELGVKFDVQQVLDDQFLPPFSTKDFMRFMVKEQCNDLVDFYLSVKDFRKQCDDMNVEVSNNSDESISGPQSDKYDVLKAAALAIVNKYLTSNSEQELNVPSQILTSVIEKINTNRIQADAFKDVTDHVLAALTVPYFSNFYQEAILKGPITLRYTVQQILDDKWHSPISLKDFHAFVIHEHCEEYVEFFMAIRKFQQQFGKLWTNISGRQSADSADVKLMDQCKGSANDILNRFIVQHAPQELNIPSNVRNMLLTEVFERRNVHPDVFKPVTENVLTILKLSIFPKFQQQVQVQITVDESLSVKSTTGIAAPIHEEFDMLEVSDTSSRAAVVYKILSRLQFQSFNFEDTTENKHRSRINAIWKLSGDFFSEPQFADMVTPAQLKHCLQQTLDDKIPPPLSSRDFRTFLKREKKAHQVDFYLAVKRYKRLCERIPEGLLNNPSNASKLLTLSAFVAATPAPTPPAMSPLPSPTSPNMPVPTLSPTSSSASLSSTGHSTIPAPERASSPTVTGITNSMTTPGIMARARMELSEIISKYVEADSKFCVPLPMQIKLFLNSEINKNGNWSPHIFDTAVQHIFQLMQHTSFPAFYKVASTSAKGVKLKIVGTKQTSRGDKKIISQSSDSASSFNKALDDLAHTEEDALADSEASSSGGKIGNLLFQVLADKCPPPLSRNDFYLFLKREHSDENFDFYMSVLSYRKMSFSHSSTSSNSLQGGSSPTSYSSPKSSFAVSDQDVKAAAMKIVNTFVLSNSEREICLPSKVKAAIFNWIQSGMDEANRADIFNDAFLEVLNILRTSSFPKFLEENAKDINIEDNGLHTIVPVELEHTKEASGQKSPDEGSLIVQVLQNKLSPPLSLADFYNYLMRQHTEKDLEFVLLMEHYRKFCKDIPEFVLRNGVTVHATRTELYGIILEISEKFLTRNELMLPDDVRSHLIADLNHAGDYHPDVFERAHQFVMEKLKTTSIPSFYTQGLELEKGW